MNEQLKNVKLVVFDLDGSLLNDFGEVGNESKRLIKELERLGVKFSFASGRLHSAMVNLARELEIDTPVISLDGSIIKSCTNNKIIYESYIPKKYVKKAIKLADERLLRIALCHADSIFFSEHNSTIKEQLDKFGAEYTEVGDYEGYMDKTLEIVIAGDQKDSMKYVADRLIFPFSFGLETSFYKSQSHRGIYYVEIRKQGSSKGKGLLKLAKYLKIKEDEVAVLGDWYNDRSLFDTRALKAAVANAVDEIKYLADVITQKSNNEDGAAEFLRMIYDAKNGLIK